MTPRVLFFTPGVEEYQADGLLHGLRALLGERVVDYPKQELLYETCPDHVVAGMRGRGMTLYRTLEDVPVPRARVWSELRWGEFDLAVFADVTRRWGAFVELLPFLGETPAAVLDGDDDEWMYPYGGRWWRRPYLWALPRAHTRYPYYKRELTPRTLSYRWFRLVPPGLAARLPRPRNLRPLAFSIPAEKLYDGPAEKDRLLATHVVDPEVAARVGASGEPVFANEESYYADLRRSRFGVTTKRGGWGDVRRTAKRGGWDCLRHYELAANGCVPCFRDLGRKPASCAPFGLDETNCVPYRDADDLLARLERIGDAEYAALRAGALRWARANTTVARARQFLAELGFELPAARAHEDPVQLDEVA